jgi:hypothetical protein
MKLIPVESTIVCEQPIKIAKMYIIQPTLYVKKNIDPREIMQIKVPTKRAFFLPNNS